MSAPNNFGPALRRFLDGRGLSLRQAGEILDQFHTALSSAISGAAPMSAKNLETILGHIRGRHSKLGMTPAEAKDAAVRLHAAWLLDSVLPEYHGMIGVVARQAPPAPATDARAAAIEFFDHLSRDNAEAAEWLIAMHRLMSESPKKQAKRRRTT